MVAIPEEMPVTPPVPEIVAVVEVVLHVPPIVTSVAATLSPVHTDAGTKIAEGVGFTVTV